MARLFITSPLTPRDHAEFERSVLTPVERQLIIRSFSDATYPELLEVERRGHGFYAWGLRSDPAYVEHWFHMSQGDIVLFADGGRYRRYAKVLARYENARAAREIWGDRAPEGELREYLFFLTEPVALAIELDQLTDYLPPDSPEFAPVADDVVERIEADYGSVERFARRRLLTASAGGPMVDMSGLIRLSEDEMSRLQALEPQNSKEGRQGIIDSIIRRRGHPVFRQTLLDAYERRCAITNFGAPDSLEAAYIVPYRGRFTHHASNGLLLRADVHTLFDLGKLAIDTASMTVVLADDLMDSSYRLLAGRLLRMPRETSQRPSAEALDLHRRLAGL